MNSWTNYHQLALQLFAGFKLSTSDLLDHYRLNMELDETDQNERKKKKRWRMRDYKLVVVGSKTGETYGWLTECAEFSFVIFLLMCSR